VPGINITFAEDAAPVITGPVIHRNSINGPTTALLIIENPEQYSSIDWYMNVRHWKGSTFTLNAADYSNTGEYRLTVEVIKDGRPYNRTITFTVAE